MADDEPYGGCSAGGMNPRAIPSRKILTGHDLEQARIWMKYLKRVATHSTCTRSKRGAVIVKYGKAIGTGVNGPHRGFESWCKPCMRSELGVPHKTRYELCSGEHAERAALDDNNKRIPEVREISRYAVNPWEADMHHLALDDSGKPVGSGEPSCPPCSGQILKAGIGRVILWHGGEEFEAYSARTFHELSLRNMVEHSGLRKG
tara:strand:- start:240 stop:851 length:612 start_codon:yes stop_codon:yes gene_type:complete